MKTELKNSFNIKDFSKLLVVISPFLSVRGATLCLVRDLDLVKRMTLDHVLFFSAIFISNFSFDLLASLVNIFSAFL